MNHVTTIGGAILAGLLLLAPGPLLAQTGAQPTEEGYTLFDRLGRALIQRGGVPLPETADNAKLGCQRAMQASDVVIRFALGASLPPGTPIDSPRADTRRQSAELMIEDAQATLNQLAGAGASTEQCASVLRSYGAAAFTVARQISRQNVDRNVQAFMTAAGIVIKPPPPPGKTEAELEAERAAQAEAERIAAEKAEAERVAKERAERAYAILPSMTPARPGMRAQPFRFNVYLVDTPAMRSAKDLRVCLEPGLYQRAAKPIVDLASAALEMPEAKAPIDAALADFLARLKPLIGTTFKVPGDRLQLELGGNDGVRGPTVEPVRAAAAGCHVYLASRVPVIAHDDAVTTYHVLAENVIEGVITLTALRARAAALPRLEALASPDVPAAPPAAPDPADPAATQRAAAQRCALDQRCRLAVRVAVNECALTAERRLGKAAIAREIEERQAIQAQPRTRDNEDYLDRDERIVNAALELLNDTLQGTLERLTSRNRQLVDQARVLLSNVELDAVRSAGRTQGEGSMGTPALQCYSRLADGRSAGIVLE